MVKKKLANHELAKNYDRLELHRLIITLTALAKMSKTTFLTGWEENTNNLKDVTGSVPTKHEPDTQQLLKNKLPTVKRPLAEALN